MTYDITINKMQQFCYLHKNNHLNLLTYFACSSCILKLFTKQWLFDEKDNHKSSIFFKYSKHNQFLPDVKPFTLNSASKSLLICFFFQKRVPVFYLKIGFPLRTRDSYFTILVVVFMNHILAEKSYFRNHTERELDTRLWCHNLQISTKLFGNVILLKILLSI